MKILIYEANVATCDTIRGNFTNYIVNQVSIYDEAMLCVFREAYDIVIIGSKMQFGHFVLIAASVKGVKQTGVFDGKTIWYFKLPTEGGELLKFLSDTD